MLTASGIIEITNKSSESDGGLAALVLAGGRSRRMGRDKAGLVYAGQTQLERTIPLLGRQCASVFVSLREDQAVPEDAERQGARVVRDQFGDIGPIGGILSAIESVRGESWLVVAVDLPFLEASTLEFLIANRDPSKPFTAYRNPKDGLPEPLCAIYEDYCGSVLLNSWKERGILSPRQILIQSETHLVDLPDSRALESVNTPKAYCETRRLVEGSSR